MGGMRCTGLWQAFKAGPIRPRISNDHVVCFLSSFLQFIQQHGSLFFFGFKLISVVYP